MDFNEVQNIWKSQPADAHINKEEMIELVEKFSKRSSRTVQTNEKWLMIIFTFTAVFSLVEAIIDEEGWSGALNALLIMAIPAGVYWLRRRRVSRTMDFDSSLMGNLNRAITNIQSLILMARLMIGVLITPLTIIYTIKYWQQGELLTFSRLSILGLLVLGTALIVWELIYVHSPKKQKLLGIKREILAS